MRRKDKQPGAIDYSEFTLNELKNILCNRDLPVLGRKDDLVERLKTDDKSDNTIVGNIGRAEKNDKDGETEDSDKEEDECSTNDEEQEEE